MESKTVKVVMLASNDSFGGLEIDIHNSNRMSIEDPQYVHKNPQHLYFISDEKIIKGDWCYNHLNNSILQWTSNANTIRVNKGVVLKESCSRVIATTDETLNRVVEGFKGEVIEEFLPKIPQDFIEEYCKQGGIDSVEVEYVKYAEVLNGTSLTPHDLLGLNRTQDNHVVIKPARQYSRDEVEQLLYKCQQDMHAWFQLRVSVMNLMNGLKITYKTTLS